jgi:ribonucleoside-diphosphate reductase alpha chain
VDSASGIHTRHSEYYIRTVRADKKDPLAKMMVDKGFPVESDVMKPDTGYVFSFPITSPAGCVTRDDRSAIQQLELWKTYQLYWCEHKPSITVSVKEDEWLEVGAWVYANFDIMSGVSFLPHSNHTYQQAPYQEIDEATYMEWLSKMPTNVDWSALKDYEQTDEAVTGIREYACTGGACEIV